MTVRPGAGGTDLVGSVSVNTRMTYMVFATFPGAGTFRIDVDMNALAFATFQGSGNFSGFVTKFITAIFNGIGGLSADWLSPGVPAFLNPDADDLDGGWTNELGGTSLAPSIDEPAPDDADYIKSSSSPAADICRVRLSDPFGVVQSPVKIHVRYRKAGSSQINLTVRLKQSTTVIASWVYTDISSSFVTADEVLTDPQFASITDFNDLFLEFQADAP